MMAEVRAVDGGGVVQLPGPAVEALMSLDSIAVTPSTAPASPRTILLQQQHRISEIIRVHTAIMSKLSEH